MDRALLTSLANFGHCMRLAKEELLVWNGCTKQSIHRWDIRTETRPLGKVEDIIAAMMIRELLALDVSSSLDLNRAIGGNTEALETIVRYFACTRFPLPCRTCSRIGCRGLECEDSRVERVPSHYLRRCQRHRTNRSDGHSDVERNRNAKRAIPRHTQCPHCRSDTHEHLQCWVAFPSKRPGGMPADQFYGISAPGFRKTL